MSSPRARPLLLAALAVLVIGVAAATLNSAVATGPGVGVGTGGTGSGDEADTGSEAGGGGTPFSLGLADEAGGVPVIPFPCYPFLNSPRFLLGAAAVLVVACALLYRRAGLLGPLGFLAAVGPPAVLMHALLTACRDADEVRLSLGGGRGTNASSISLGLAGEAGGGAGGGGAPASSLLLLGALALALVGAVALFLRSTGDDPAEESSTPDPGPDVPTVAIGRAAGRAADRIERDADPENAVYRAWFEMTTHLDVDRPASSTPAEFAAAAVDAGMDPDDVEELTELFEAVRYGGAEVTPEREERALAALRRIESAYAGDDA